MHLKCKCSINTVNYLNLFSHFYFKFFQSMYVLSKYICSQIHQCAAFYFIVFEKKSLIICKSNKNFVDASLKNVNFSVHFFLFCQMGHSANCSVCLSTSIINNSTYTTYSADDFYDLNFTLHIKS